MGCAASRLDDLPSVSLCRERKDFIKAAAYHRYALAASHVSYFQSLEGVGEALRKFTDQELGIGVSPSDSFLVTIPSDSFLVTIPSDSDEGKKKQNSSLTHSASVSHYQSLDEGSHSSFASSSENNSTPDRGDSNPTISKTKYSAWDFLTQFASVDRHGVGSVSSGIDSMDDEIKDEIMEEVRKGKQKVVEEILSRWDFGEGTSKMVQSKSDEENMGSVEKEIRGCSESTVSMMRRPLLVLDEFEIASNHGKEVAVMLEVWKSYQYHPRSTLRVIASRILHLIAPSMLTSSRLVSRQSQHEVESILKMAKDKYGYSADIQMKSGNLSSTLEKLFAWEEKLYKAVKNEEKFRIIYERKCKRLEILIARKAPNHKIDATWASAGKLLTKIDIATKTAEVIARRMHKLRDEELEPQITKLIEGLTRMWKSMLKCHEKQFQAIIESISRGFLANTSDRRDSSMRATFELEIELHNWCIQFILLVNTQKAYVEALNMWLLKWMLYEPEETPNGIMPFSPGKVGAPPVFIICNDWCKVMERFSETEVVNTMRAFALSLHQLWESQDVEQRQRLKAENLFKDLEQQLQSLRLEEIRTHSYGSI